MRATSSGIVIGLTLALLVPGSAVGQEASPAAPSPGVEVPATPTAAVMLVSTGLNVVSPSRAISDYLGISLDEARELVDSAPVVLAEDLSAEDAVRFAALVEEQGGTVEVSGLTPEQLASAKQNLMAPTVPPCSQEQRESSETSGLDGSYCASDLIAAGGAKVRAKSIGPILPDIVASAPSGSPFHEGACVQPVGGSDEDHAMLCLYEVATAWRQWQRRASADGLVPQVGFDAVLPAYQWVTSGLSEREKRYLDAGLRNLDEMPLDWVRAVPEDSMPPTVIQKGGRVGSGALHKAFQMAFLDTMIGVVDGPLASLPESARSGQFGFRQGPGSPVQAIEDGGVASTASACEIAIKEFERPPQPGFANVPIRCADSAASAWLMYLATGDERFIKVAQAHRQMGIAAHKRAGCQRDPAQMFDRQFACITGAPSAKDCERAGYAYQCLTN